MISRLEAAERSQAVNYQETTMHKYGKVGVCFKLFRGLKGAAEGHKIDRVIIIGYWTG